MIRFATTFIAIVFSFLWFTIAWKSWQDKTATIVLKQPTESSLANTLPIIPSLITRPLKRALSQASKGISTSDKINYISDEYLKRKPFDASGWLWASQFALQNNQVERSNKLLSVAHALSRNHKSKLERLFSAYIERNKINEATLVAHDLLYADPNLTSRYLYYLSRLTNDESGYTELLNDLLPDTVPTHRDFKKDVFYRLAIDASLRMKNAGLSKAVWLKTPADLKVQAHYGLKYLFSLAKEQDWPATKQVWQDLTQQRVEIEQIKNANFEEPLNNFTPCWRIQKAKGALASLDDNAFKGSSSLLVQFTGEHNINYHHSTCLIPVIPETHYQLSGKWMGQNISTLSGPYLDIYAPASNTNNKSLYARSDKMLGNWPWMDVSIEFTVPKDMHLITLRLRRNKTDYLDSKIAGKVWVDSFKLNKLKQTNLL